MTEQTKQNADKQSTIGEKQEVKTTDETQTAQVNSNKRAYVKPTLRKFSQIDYVTAYGVD